MPSRILTRLLRALLPPHTCDSITGDLLEEFCERSLTDSRGAQRWYARQVWSFVVAAPWFACAVRTSLGWFAVFALSCGWAIAAPVYTPGLAVFVFLLALPSIGFYVANRTENFRAGVTASVLAGSCMLALAVSLILYFGLRHPPASSTPVPFAIGLGLAAVSAFVGKCAAERMEHARLSL